MAAPIQSPAKCEVRSIIRFLNAKCERPAEIHKKNVAVYGNVIISTCFLTWTFREWVGGNMDWVDLAQDRDRWRDLVNAVKKIRVPYNVWNFLTS